jgi:hypothetical protein
VGTRMQKGFDSVDLDKQPLPDGYRVELIERG